MIPSIRGVTIIGPIGNGAGSVVFKARDEKTGELLAVKSVTRHIVAEIQKQAPSPEHIGAPEKMFHLYVGQVRNEWRLGHRLTHDAGGHGGVPRVHRLIVQRGLLILPRGVHLLMDFVDGENLRKDRNYTAARLVRIYREAADILRFLHRNGIIHADMKPHHIMIDKGGTVQLLDLGLACHPHGHTAKVVGSPDYMAPEQLAGAGVDERTDVYGLGATMFWALTGRTIRPTVSGSSMLGSMDLQLRSFETSVRQHNPDVSEALEDVVLRSCAPSRRARLTLAEVIARLDRLLG